MNGYTTDEILYGRILTLMQQGFSQQEAVQIVAESVRAARDGAKG